LIADGTSVLVRPLAQDDTVEHELNYPTIAKINTLYKQIGDRHYEKAVSRYWTCSGDRRHPDA
jgi:hypothetical protein